MAKKALSKLLESQKADCRKLGIRVDAATLRKIDKDFAEIAESDLPRPTMRDMQDYFQSEYGVKMSPNTIRNHIRKHG